MCGIIGVIESPEAAEEIFLGLQNLQHRGQDGGGIVTVFKNSFSVQRGPGLVDIAFPVENFRKLQGTAGIGHTRYATTGSKDESLLQPFINNDSKLAIAHNGNIVNFHALKKSLNDDSDPLHTGSDSEIILHQLSSFLSNQPVTPTALFHAIAQLSHTIIGSYSVVGIQQEIGLFAFRDPQGIRPLVMGRRHNPDTKTTTIAFASESTALEFLGYTDLANIEAGESVIVCWDGKILRQRYTEATPKHCMFEWVYFARVESNIDDLSVYQARFNLGAELAKEVQRQGLSPDIVVPVPETSRIAAIALAEELRVPFREVLIKNRYVNRTFILESQAARQEAIHRKLYPVSSELEGKKVLVVDDSIVRGNTAIKIIELLRKSGASEIYLASTCPPIQFPCYYGIDFPSPEELLAGKFSQEQLPEILGVDALVYQPLEGLKKALKADNLCMACLTNTYPTDISAAEEFSQIRTREREVVRG